MPAHSALLISLHGVSQSPPAFLIDLPPIADFLIFSSHQQLTEYCVSSSEHAHKQSMLGWHIVLEDVAGEARHNEASRTCGDTDD